MKKNIIITEQDINNIILQTLNEMAQNTRWIESYIKILQNFNNNTNTNRNTSNLYELLYSNQRYFTTRTLSKIINSHILSSKNSDSSINIFESEDDVYQMVNPYFVMSFIGINAEEIINSAIQERKNKGKKWNDEDLRNSVIRDISRIEKNKNFLLDYVKENSDSIDNVKLQERSCYLYASCYYLIANVYGIKDSGDLTSKSNHSYEDNFDIKDDSVNIDDDSYKETPLDALTQSVKKIHNNYKDISPNYSIFLTEVINWVNKNDDIIKQKFNDILIKYKTRTHTSLNAYLGMIKGVRLTLLALYLGRNVPEVVNKLSETYKIDTEGLNELLKELSEVNNSINDWETLNKLTQKLVNKKNIRVVLYRLIRQEIINMLNKNTSINYSTYIDDLINIFQSQDIEGKTNYSQSFAQKYGFSNEVKPKNIDLYSYWRLYEDYFNNLGGNLLPQFKNLKDFLTQKLRQIENEKKRMSLIRVIYGIFFTMNSKLGKYIKTKKITQQNEINKIRQNLFIKINNEIDIYINKVKNGETKNFDPKNNADTVNKNINIAESKIKQIIYETIKRYLK